jgi:hypothetical protein
VLSQVTLGLLVLLLVLNLFGFLFIFSYFNSIETQLLTASTNFQASNEGIAEAIVSLGSLLDDLDEVSGDLVRPPQISDILGQGLQMFMISKFQDMFPQNLAAGMAPMFNNEQVSNSNTWQEVKEANNLAQEEQQA